MGKPKKKKRNKDAFHTGPKRLYLILRGLVILVMARQIWLGNWDNVLTCLLTLVLFLLPSVAERRLKLDLPDTLETIILLFIFAAEILGEIGEFYVNVRGWDTMLHTVNGFFMGAIGFALIDLLNRHPRFHFNLSPLFVAFVAFCFSMTIGVLWEFFEYGVDRILLKDMQKDAIVTTISSVTLHPDGRNIPVILEGITGTTVHHALGETRIPGGYLDIGLRDTMKDLLVNFIGAVVFSVLGFFYIKGRSKFPAKFIPRLLTQEEYEAAEKERAARVESLRQARQLRREKRRQKKEGKKE